MLADTMNQVREAEQQAAYIVQNARDRAQTIAENARNQAGQKIADARSRAEEDAKAALVRARQEGEKAKAGYAAGVRKELDAAMADALSRSDIAVDAILAELVQVK